MSNVFSCTGTVGRDAEVRVTPSGQSVLTVSVANNVGFGDKQQTVWLRCTLWGKRAEGGLADYLKKGQAVFVSGELSQHEYTSKQDGTAKTSLELNCNVLDLVGKKGEGGKPPSGPGTAGTGGAGQQDNFTQSRDERFDDFDDDIPF